MPYFLTYDTSTGEGLASGTFEGSISDLFLVDGTAAIETPDFVEDTGAVRVVDGEVLAAIVDVAAQLEMQKAAARFEANTSIDALRRSLATDIAFQQEAYYKKRAEAEAYTADPTGYPAAFPLLSSIATIRAMTPADLAALWLTTADDTWGPVLNLTEIARERAVVAIAAATDQAGVDAALAQLETDIAALGAST